MYGHTRQQSWLAYQARQWPPLQQGGGFLTTHDDGRGIEPAMASTSICPAKDVAQEGRADPVMLPRYWWQMACSCWAASLT